MFVEPSPFTRSQQPRSGWIEVVCGAMFSGKTEELIRRLNRAKIARLNVEIFKPAVDKRYHEQDIVSHNDTSIRSTPVHTASEILLLAGSCDVVGIDEAQFFDTSLVEVCTLLANQGKRVIVAGLDMDYRGVPFGPMPLLMASAEYVTKVHPICVVCGGIASFSYRISPQNQQLLLGEADHYEARCRRCFQLGESAER